MKNFSFAFLFLILAMPAFSQWEQVYQITANNIYRLYALDNQHVFLGAEYGDLLKSNNAGVDFEAKDLEPYGFIFAVDFENQTTGYAGGGCYFPFDECPGNTFYKTEDGGNSWVKLHGELMFGVYTDIESLGNGKLFAANEFYGLMYSDDGGVTLTPVTVDGALGNPRYQQIQFLDDQTGFVGVINFDVNSVISQYIYRTEDSGATWASIFEISESSYENGGFYFTDKQTGFVLGNGGKLWRTTNGGVNWTELQYGASNETGRDIFFSSGSTGYIASHTNDFSQGRIYRSSDGGLSWEIDLEVDSAFFDYLSFTDDENGFAVSYYQTVYRRTGTNSTPQATPQVDVDIFPNPAREYVEIKGNFPSGKYELLINDIMGRNLKKIDLDNSGTRINTGDLATGIYFLKLINNQGKQAWAGKIIKQ